MNILIVDDEPLVRKSLGRACKAKGHQVVEAADGQEGLNLWLGNEPDLVFLDVLMPGLSGPEVLTQVSQHRLANPAKPTHKNAHVVLMSAYSGEHNIATAQQMGADLFIPKPFEDIFAVVTRGEELMLK